MRSRDHCSWVVAWCFALGLYTWTKLFVLCALPKSRAGQYWTVTCTSLLSNLLCPCFIWKVLLEMPKGKKRGWRWLVVESSQVVVKLGQFESYWHSYVNFITFGLFCFLDETYMKGRLQIVRKKLLFLLFLLALKQVGVTISMHQQHESGKLL